MSLHCVKSGLSLRYIQSKKCFQLLSKTQIWGHGRRVCLSAERPPQLGDDSGKMLHEEHGSETHVPDTYICPEQTTNTLSSPRNLSIQTSHQHSSWTWPSLSCHESQLPSDVTHFSQRCASAHLLARQKFSQTLHLVCCGQALWSNSSLVTNVTAPIDNSSVCYSTLNKGKIMKHVLGSDMGIDKSWNIENYGTDSGETSGHKVTVKSEQKGNKLQGGEASGVEMLETTKRLKNLIYKLFTGQHDYGVLHNDVIWESNLFGKNKICSGSLAYATELMKMRVRFHANFSSAVVEIKEIRVFAQDRIIQIHWCLKAVSQTQVLKFWKIFQRKAVIGKGDYDHIEACSYFHLDQDGLVHKHRIERMNPTSDRKAEQTN